MTRSCDLKAAMESFTGTVEMAIFMFLFSLEGGSKAVSCVRFIFVMYFDRIEKAASALDSWTCLS